MMFLSLSKSVKGSGEGKEVEKMSLETATQEEEESFCESEADSSGEPALDSYSSKDEEAGSETSFSSSIFPYSLTSLAVGSERLRGIW